MFRRLVARLLPIPLLMLWDRLSVTLTWASSGTVREAMLRRGWTYVRPGTDDDLYIVSGHRWTKGGKVVRAYIERESDHRL